jgi:hypothetical protein
LKVEWNGTYVLVDQQHGNVFPLLGEVLEGLLDSRRFGLGVDDEEIPLGVWAVCDVLGCC